MTMENSLHEKQHRLEERLRGCDGLLVAYSGGVDSAFLAWSARQVLGEGMRAVIADSPSLARSHLAEALAFARMHGLPLEVVSTLELENPAYAKNDAQRCFHCKNELFTVMERERARLGFRYLAYGMNVDDAGDFRPGQSAAREHGVLAPLVEAGLSKQDVRALARRAGLEVWDKPASACLSSRLVYGRPVTREALSRVEEGEDRLRQLGFRHFRVRDHGEIARIEIAREELTTLSPRTLEALAHALKPLGFLYVTLDCEGYRSGSMNVALSVETQLAHAHRLS
jgi:uncharacterized protein